MATRFPPRYARSNGSPAPNPNAALSIAVTAAMGSKTSVCTSPVKNAASPAHCAARSSAAQTRWLDGAKLLERQRRRCDERDPRRRRSQSAHHPPKAPPFLALFLARVTARSATYRSRPRCHLTKSHQKPALSGTTNYEHPLPLQAPPV